MSQSTKNQQKSAITPAMSSQAHSAEEVKNSPANDSSINTLQIRQDGLKKFLEAADKSPYA